MLILAVGGCIYRDIQISEARKTKITYRYIRTYATGYTILLDLKHSRYE